MTTTTHGTTPIRSARAVSPGDHGQHRTPRLYRRTRLLCLTPFLHPPMIASPKLDQFVTVVPSNPRTTRTTQSDRQSSSTPSLITITITAPQSFDRTTNAPTDYKTVTVEIPVAHGPALRSAIDELKSSIGGKLEKPSTYIREAALTRAASAVGQLFRAVCQTIPNYDRDYNHISN